MAWWSTFASTTRTKMMSKTPTEQKRRKISLAMAYGMTEKRLMAFSAELDTNQAEHIRDTFHSQFPPVPSNFTSEERVLLFGTLYGSKKDLTEEKQ
jgi:hypothetical protein